jgi:hypothetical protein
MDCCRVNQLENGVLILAAFQAPCKTGIFVDNAVALLGKRTRIQGN